MRIKTQSKIAMILFGAILFAVVTSVIVTSRQVKMNSEQEKIAGDIARGASDLGYLTNDYLIYRQSRQLRRWQAKFTRFSKQVAGLHAGMPEEQALVTDIEKSEKRLKKVFDSVTSAPGGLYPSQGVIFNPALLQVSWSRMAIQVHSLMFDASRLSRLFRVQAGRLKQINLAVVFAMIGVFSVYILVNYLMIQRRTLKSLAILQDGAAVIGSGNLDFVIAEKSDDEIGDLSRAFNRMTADLRTVTASKADLEREIAERKRAEEALRDHREWLRVTLSSIGDAVLTTDTQGLITFLNPVAESMTGWQLEEASGQPIEAVFRIVNEKTRKPAENVVERVLLEGCVVNLVNNTVLVSKLGREIPIEDSAAPIRDSADNLIGVVLVFHDVSEKRRAQEAIVRSKEEWELTFKSIPDLIAILDDQHRVLRANPAMARRLGLTPEECVGIPCHKVVHGMDGPPGFCPHFLTLMDGREHTMEIYEERLGGHFLVSTTPVFNEEGRITGSVHVARDITERRRMEDELRKSRDELESRVQERTKELIEANRVLKEKAEIIDLAHDAIIVRDFEGRIVFWSRGARETFGFTAEEALGQVSHHLLQTQFPEPLDDLIKTVLEKGEWKGELKHTKANGENIVVDSRWAMQTGRDGEAARFLEINRDITPSKIMEEEFRRADRAFRTLSECNQALVRQTEEMELLEQVCRIVVDVGGYRMAWVGFAENDANKTVSPVAHGGYDQGYLDQAKITWADTERGKGPTGTAVRTGKIIISQNALLNPGYKPWCSEGTRRGYAASIALPLIVDGKAIGALTIYAPEPDAFDEREVSFLSNLAENLAYGIASIRMAIQRRQSEKDLKAYASRLEITNKELEEFAFVASHDLQEPLRKIQTFCDLAQKRCSPVLDSASKEYLERVVNSASRMRQLLDDLLQFSRVATKPEPFKMIDLEKIVREAADIFEKQIKETGGLLETENLPEIEVDESQSLQLFQNLIGNALKYRSEESPRIRVSAKQDEQGSCEICVEDNGIGFEQQYAERIFKPFQRLHSRTEYEGTGMGLAICRKIAERHGGSIRAESEPGKGSTFIIRLPVRHKLMGA